MITLTDLSLDLVLAGYGTLGTDLFTSHFPKEPNNVISIHAMVNAHPTRTMGVTDHENNIIQVIVRNTDHDSGYQIARNIYTRWDRFVGVKNGTRYLSILAQSDPFFLGMDENNRFRWTCSFNVRRAV